jgi:hypothetical protein
MDLASAPRRTARKKGCVYENAFCTEWQSAFRQRNITSFITTLTSHEHNNTEMNSISKRDRGQNSFWPITVITREMLSVMGRA